jgi:hypothetical protein
MWYRSVISVTMQVMVQKGKGSMQPYSNTITAYRQGKNSLIVNDGDKSKEIEGEIVNVSNPDVVSISSYYGSETSRINSSDIYAINNEAVSLYCNQAMQVSNRVSIQLKSGEEIEISGKILGCRILD